MDLGSLKFFIKLFSFAIDFDQPGNVVPVWTIIWLLWTALKWSLLGAVVLYLIKIGVHCFQGDESARQRALELLDPNIRRCLIVAGISLALLLVLLVFAILFVKGA